MNEIIYLKEKGLIKGGSLDSAVVVADPEKDKDEIKKLEKLFWLFLRRLKSVVAG